MIEAAPQNTILVKPLGGIAGDMFVGACADLWPDGREQCLADIAAVGLPEGVSTRFEDVSVNGFAAQKFHVSGSQDRIVPTGAFGAIRERLTASRLDRDVLATALRILTILAEAESRVHGKSVDHVHFHELADWDSIADVVGAASFIARRPAARWIAGPLPLGGGMVQTQHGRITVPAPAVLELLDGYAFADDQISGERVTPTGAAILRHLTDPDDKMPASARLSGSGFGAGDKRFAGLANVLQLVALRTYGAPRDEQITELSFDIDDMTAEELAVAADRIRAAKGVLDLTQTIQLGKKGRAMTMLRLLCQPVEAEALMTLCFEETSTLAVRRAGLHRRILERRITPTPGGNVKLALRPSGTATAKAESDDLASTPTLDARRAKARHAMTTAMSASEEPEA